MEEHCFVSDIYLPETLFAITIRSPVAQGKLKTIVIPRLPDNYTLIKAQDIPGKNILEDTQMPLLASDTLSYIGEPVALLLGPDKNKLDEYSRQCKVIVEEGMPVFSLTEAKNQNSENNRIAAHRDICIGDPDSAFSRAASIIYGDYSSGIQEHWYAEPCGAIAWFDVAGGVYGEVLVVQTATQWPYHVRRSVIQALGLSENYLKVISAKTAFHLDGKLWYPSLISCHAALGAFCTGKPVRLILTREEDFLYSPKRCATEINISSAIDENGKVIGMKINTAVNLGSYGVNANEILDHVNLGSMGIYQIENMQITSFAVKTDIPPQGPLAGFGLAQGFFAMERHVSHIADTLQQDPALWRIQNNIHNGMLPMSLAIKDAPSAEQLILPVQIKSDYCRKWASYELLRHSDSKQHKPRGIGIALAYQGNGLLYTGADKNNYSIEVMLDKDGSLEIKSSMGADHGRLWAQIASDILGVDTRMVRINSTPDAPDSGPLTMSRHVTVIAKLVEQACLAISKKRFRDPLPISVRKSIRLQKNSAAIDFFSDASADPLAFIRPGWACAIVEVEIDSVEYIPHIRGVWISVDGGKILDEDRARKSLNASVMQALGWAYYEQIHFIKGFINRDQYDNFNIFSALQIPAVSIDFVGNNQSEAKGIGDLPFSCIPAAFLQAVSQALNHHFQSIPLKELDIWYTGVKTIMHKEAPV